MKFHTYTLTEGIDVATANVFNADRGWTPGGTDQVNTLDDDDVLTGAGTNPTLNFTFVDDSDTGVVVVTPTLNGIETINVIAAGAAAKTLDLQDATGVNEINVSRVNNYNMTVQNIASVTPKLSVTDSQAAGFNITFNYLAAALSGAADETEVTLNNVNIANLIIEENNAVPTQGYETINLVSSKSANSITGTLRAEDLKTLNITGDQNLTIGGFANAAGSLSKIDASALTGNMTLGITAGLMNAVEDGKTSGTIALNVLTGAGSDTIRVFEQVNANDSIDAGEGTDTMRIQSNGVAALDAIQVNAAGNACRRSRRRPGN